MAREDFDFDEVQQLAQRLEAVNAKAFAALNNKFTQDTTEEAKERMKERREVTQKLINILGDKTVLALKRAWGRV